MKKVHFLGIGGSGMNAAAGIAHKQGYQVSGCDSAGKPTEYTQALIDEGIKIEWDHTPDHLEGIDILCVTPAVFHQSIKLDEVTKAEEMGLPVQTWQEFVGKELSHNKKVIAIAGTKGKSTTTSLIGYLLETAGYDPNVVVGAKVLNWDKNYRVGKGNWFVVEADEFNNNFLHYHPNIAVITNIEYDHPEFFKSYEEYLESFVAFVKTVSEEGLLILCSDSPGVADLAKRIDFFKGKILYYGAPKNRETDDPETSLEGEHNALNIQAMFMVGGELGIQRDVIVKTLASFKGVGRRFELICDKKGVRVYNDYAHNPMSVAAVIKGALPLKKEGRIISIFQPHLYSRTKQFLASPQVFEHSDIVVITTIYASREKDMPISHEVSGQDLVEKIQEAYPEKEVRYIGDFSEVVDFVMSVVRSGDIVINMGAGDNGIIAEDLSERLD